LQIEDSYGNLSEVSEEYKIMPSQEYIDKYCSTSDAGSNVNINSSNSDSGGCSILILE
jgi:hypothetical protein